MEDIQNVPIPRSLKRIQYKLVSAMREHQNAFQRLNLAPEDWVFREAFIKAEKHIQAVAKEQAIILQRLGDRNNENMCVCGRRYPSPSSSPERSVISPDPEEIPAIPWKCSSNSYSHASQFLSLENFMESLGLISHEKFAKLKTEFEERKKERKRRSTANPKYNGYVFAGSYVKRRSSRLQEQEDNAIWSQDSNHYSRDPSNTKRMKLLDSVQSVKCAFCYVRNCDVTCGGCESKFHHSCVRVQGTKAPKPLRLPGCPQCVKIQSSSRPVMEESICSRSSSTVTSEPSDTESCSGSLIVCTSPEIIPETEECDSPSELLHTGELALVDAQHASQAVVNKLNEINHVVEESSNSTVEKAVSDNVKVEKRRNATRKRHSVDESNKTVTNGVETKLKETNDNVDINPTIESRKVRRRVTQVKAVELISISRRINAENCADVSIIKIPVNSKKNGNVTKATQLPNLHNLQKEVSIKAPNEHTDALNTINKSIASSSSLNCSSVHPSTKNVLKKDKFEGPKIAPRRTKVTEVTLQTKSTNPIQQPSLKKPNPTVKTIPGPMKLKSRPKLPKTKKRPKFTATYQCPSPLANLQIIPPLNPHLTRPSTSAVPRTVTSATVSNSPTPEVTPQQSSSSTSSIFYSGDSSSSVGETTSNGHFISGPVNFHGQPPTNGHKPLSYLQKTIIAMNSAANTVFGGGLKLSGSKACLSSETRGKNGGAFVAVLPVSKVKPDSTQKQLDVPPSTETNGSCDFSNNNSGSQEASYNAITTSTSNQPTQD